MIEKLAYNMLLLIGITINITKMLVNPLFVQRFLVLVKIHSREACDENKQEWLMILLYNIIFKACDEVFLKDRFHEH